MDVAATLLILRATDLLTPGHSHHRAAEIALLLYAGYNLTATLTSLPAGHVSDRRGTTGMLTTGAACFLVAYAGFAATGADIALLAICFAIAGVGIGCTETVEHAAVATLAPDSLRGSAFGLLAAVQSVGNLAASAIAGALWTWVSPRAAFLYLAAWMIIAVVAFVARPGDAPVAS